MLILNHKSALANSERRHAAIPWGRNEKAIQTELLCFIITYTAYSSKAKTKDIEVGQAILDNYKSKWRHIYSFRRHRLLALHFPSGSQYLYVKMLVSQIPIDNELNSQIWQLPEI